MRGWKDAADDYGLARSLAPSPFSAAACALLFRRRRRRPFSRCSVESSCGNEPENCRTRHRDRERRLIRLRCLCLPSFLSPPLHFFSAQRSFDPLSPSLPCFRKHFQISRERNNMRSSASNLKPRGRGCGSSSGGASSP